MSHYPDIPHLRQIAQATVDALCDRVAQRVEQLATDSYSVRLEAKAFRESCTPHDATRLANALEIYDEKRMAEPIWSLIRDLDAAAEERAGMVPSNRFATRH